MSRARGNEQWSEKVDELTNLAGGKLRKMEKKSNLAYGFRVIMSYFTTTNSCCVLYKHFPQRQHPYHQHGLSELCVLTDHGCVDVLAKDRLVVIDISEVDVHSSNVTERRRTTICSLYSDVVFMRELIIQPFNHKNVT